MAQEVPRLADIGIALVLDPAQVIPARVGKNVIAPDHQQRPKQPTVARSHRPRPAHSSAAQEIEQHGLGPITAMMRK